MIRASLADSSVAWYSRIWRLYSSYCASSHAPLLPPDHDLIASFLASLTSHPPLARAITNVVSALKHGFARFDTRWFPSPKTQLVINGILRTAPPAKSLRRDAFLPCHLSALLDLLGSHPSVTLPLVTAAATALFLGLRPSEVASLRRSDLVRLDDASFRISFQRKKSRRGPVSDSRIIRSPILVALLNRFLRTTSSDRLFDLPDARAVNALASSISHIIDVPYLFGHSFRIGTATSLALSGYPATEIRAWGDWRSKSYLRYIRNSRAHSQSHDPLRLFPPYSQH